MEEKNHELCVKKKCQDEEEKFETDQEIGGRAVVHKKEENVARKEDLVVKHESEMKSEGDVLSSVKSENGELADEAKCYKNYVGSSVGVECHWLPPIIQQLLTHIYQRALLEESDENLHLVFKVGRKVSVLNLLGSLMF